MKKIMRMKSHYILITIVLLAVTSCKEKVQPQKGSLNTTETVSSKVKSEAKLKIGDYFSGPNYMKIIASDNNQLELSSEQENAFAEWRKENHSKIENKMNQISVIEKEIKSLSQDKSKVEEILSKLNASANLRKEIAAIKIECRDQIIKTLNNEQWNKLAVDYQKKFPFEERKDMMDLMHHVNPVSNFMQVINTNSSELELTEEQQNTIDDWSRENHPRMMEMANEIIDLEKEIYKASIEKDSKEKISGLVNQIEEIRIDIVTTKTNCRDLIIKTLNPNQWEALIEKTQ